MIRIFHYTITDDFTNKTILDFLKAMQYPHAVLVHLKKTPESILLNGIWEYVTAKLTAGDTLKITLEETNCSANIVPASIPLNLIYEDEDILVVNKPSGMPVHPSLGHYENTLANAVCGYYSEQGIPYTFRCVNRLDRDTTGLVILAKHMLSSAILSCAVSRREIHREYLAIAEGLVPESGIIDAPIARKTDSAIERQVDFDRGERAVTHYKRLAYQNGLSLLSLNLETGRTHQIRVHMKYLGHPLLGDFLYNPNELPDADIASVCNFDNKIKRQALHSYRLQFIHPITGLSMEFTAPLPKDMLQFFPDSQLG